MSAGPHPFHAPFPIEIEEHIIDQLVDHFASIRNCSLTCRAWVPRSRFHLFGAVQITTGSALDAVLDYFQTNPHMRPLVRSLATAPTPTERTRLLGTYPASLIRMLPNLRRWEMRAPLVDAKNHPPKVFFHRTTLIQLRCSPITELHVSSIHFPSQGEFVRLISSIPLLRVLQCTDVHFGTTNGIPFNNASPLRRRPKGLSTLQVSHWKEDDDLLPWLLEVSQSSLQNIVLRHQKNVKWQSAAIMPVMSQLRSLTLHVEQQPYDGIDTLYWDAFKDAFGCMQALRCGSTLKRLEIHLYLCNSSKNTRDRAPCNDPVSLALLLSGDSIRNCCQVLEQALLADRAVHLSIVTHLPSFWTHREVVLRTLREDAFPNLHSKGLLDVGYSGGNSCQSCVSTHNGPVSTLVVSPDGKWIASASSNLAILWSAHSNRRPVREWINPMDYSVTMGSFAFSPDSERLACCAHTKGRRPFVQILSTGEGSRRLAILEGPALQADDGPVSQLVCAWFPDRLIFVCLARSTILVRIWDAQTFEAHFGWQDTTPIRGGSLLLSCDGRRLAVVAIYRPLDDIFLPTNTLRTANPSLCVLWDLETGGPREVLNARGAADKVLAASFDPQGERLVLSFADHAIRVWSVATRESLLSVAEPIPVEFDPRYHLYSRIMSRSSEVFSKAVVFSPDGRFLLSLRYMRIEARRETLAMLWDSRSGRPLLRWDDTQPSGGLCRNSGLALFSPTGTHVAFTANDGRVHMFDLSRGLWAQEDMTTQFGLRHDATSLVLSPDGQTLCWGTHGGQVEIHSL